MPTVDELLGIKPRETSTIRKSAKVPLEGRPRLQRQSSGRRTVALRKRANAKDALGDLPEPGESIHGIMTGDYDGFDLVDAILTIAGTPCNRLHLATLGFAERNVVRLLELMDAGTVRKATMIVSQWYEADAKERHVVNRLARELPARGGWYVSTRSHAKVAAFAMSDGRHFVLETSANLRTCRSIEQFVLTHDAALFRFHAAWMKKVYERYSPAA